jgi:hypothetical protein
MKKLLTLVFCLGTLSSVIAQNRDYRFNDDRRNNYPGNDRRENYEARNNDRGRRYDDAFTFTVRERDGLINRINREYDNKIESVRRKWLMNSLDKRRLISSLEFERSSKIKGVYAKFADSRNRYYDGYSYNRGR